MKSDFECLIGDHHSAVTAVNSTNVRSAHDKSQTGGVQWTNLIKHVSQVVLGTNPGRHSVTEENKVLEKETDGTVRHEKSQNLSAQQLKALPHLHHPCRVDTDHYTDSTKGGVLFLVISYVPQ